MSKYAYADRDKAYALIAQTDQMQMMLEQIGTGEAAPNPDLQTAITHMTGTSDLNEQFRQMKALHEQVKKAHMDRIFAAAPTDFSAYVEAINPDEACRSQVHRFLADKLTAMAKRKNAKMALSMPPGHAKDLCVETPVLMGDGSSKRLGDIVVGDMVITHTGKKQEVLEVHDQGVRETIILHTASNRKIRAHPDHPFLTPSGWIPAKDLTPGDVLAQQREFDIANTSGRTREEFILAGYLMAYGMVKNRVYSRLKTIDRNFKCNDPQILEDVVAIGKTLGFRTKLKGTAKLYGRDVRTLVFEESFRYWLEAQGLWDQHRHEMRIPEWVFKGSYRDIGAFVGSVVSMDAQMMPGRHGRNRSRQSVLQIRVRNAGLVKDYRRLLMRLGVRSELMSVRQNNYNYEPTVFHNLTLREDEDIFFLQKAVRLTGDTKRFWDKPYMVRRFFDGRYAEDKIVAVLPADPTETRCLTVDTDNSFLADGIVAHNSTYCSRLFPSWWIASSENRKWLQAGHTQKFAEKEFGKKTRDTILKTPAFARVFPGVFLTADDMSDLQLSNGSTYVTKGVGQGISGYRSNFNNIDDPYPTEKSAQSEVTRNTVWDWWTNDFRTRRLPGAQELIIVTRWHSDDIVGRLEDLIAEGEMEGDWDIVNLPAFSLGPEVDQLRRKKGDVLWPEFFTESFLRDIQRPMNPSRFESLYQGSPHLADGLVLQRKWIKSYDKAPSLNATSRDPVNPLVPEKIPAFILQGRGPSESEAGPSNPEPDNFSLHKIRVVISVDSAEKETVRADFSAIQAWCYANDRKHYLLDVVREKLEFPKLVEQIENMARKWSADLILCETKGAGNQYIQSRQAAPDRPCAILGYNPGRDDKTIRFEGTMTVWQAGDVLLPTRAPWLNTYTDELLRFPNGKNDDNVDATSQYLNWHRAGGMVRRGTKKLQGSA